MEDHEYRPTNFGVCAICGRKQHTVHTAGPWTVEHIDSPGQGEWHGWNIRGKHGVITSIGAASQRGPIDMESNQANARLISAAPEMYDYLCQLRDNTTPGGFTRMLIDPILRKIEGK